MGRTARLDRSLLVLLGVLLTAAGVLTLLVGLGIFGSTLRNNTVIDNPVGRFFGHNGPAPWPPVALAGLRLGLPAPTGRITIGGSWRRLVHSAQPDRLNLPVEAEDLHRRGVPQSLGIHLLRPKAPLHDRPVSLVDRPSLRGEARPAATARLWPARWAGCP